MTTSSIGKKNIASLIAIAFACSSLTGCQGTPFGGLSMPGWGNATRVQPPATGSFQAPGNYNGGVGTTGSLPAPVTTTITTPPGGVPAIGPMQGGIRTSQMSTSPPQWVNTIANAQNQLQSASQNARTAVQQGADQLNSRVEQASARVDRFGQGVVQAGQILNEAATTPLIASPSNLTDRSFAPNADGIPGTNGYGAASPTGATMQGSPSTLGVPTTSSPVDPNAQWRSPTSR